MTGVERARGARRGGGDLEALLVEGEEVDALPFGTNISAPLTREDLNVESVSADTDLTGSGTAITTSGQKYLTVAEVDASDRARAVGVVKLS